MYKRLERGRFRLPAVQQLTLTELTLVLEGIDLSVRRFKTVACQRIA
jgi:transposase